MPGASVAYEREQCPAPSPAKGHEGPPVDPGEGWGEGLRVQPRFCFS